MILSRLFHHPQNRKHCNALQHTATHCNTLQRTATYCPLYLSRYFRDCFITHKIENTATHGNTLQNTATHCNAQQNTATHCNTLSIIPVMMLSRFIAHKIEHTATHGNTLQHTATHCNTLQHTATHCSTLQHTVHYTCHDTFAHELALATRVLYNDSHQLLISGCVVVRGSVLQCVAVCCSVLQCVAVRCSALQCVRDIIILSPTILPSLPASSTMISMSS